jgi:hypothetical protein
VADGQFLTYNNANSQFEVDADLSAGASGLTVSKSQNSETNYNLTNQNTGADAQVRTKYTTDGGIFTVGKTSNAHAFGGDAYIHNVDNTNIRFATNDTERMRIKADGTTQLNGQLDFVDSGSKIVRPTANALGVNVGSIEAVRFTSSGGAIFNNTENINQNFTVKASGNSNAVFVDGNGGNVGIGTSSTSTNYGAYRTPLIVEHPQGYGYVEIRSGTTNNQAGLVINRQDNTGWLQAMNNNGKLRIAPMASIDQTGLTNAKDGSSGITIDTSGNIGLNEASPDKQLHLTTNTSGLITSGNNRQGSVIRLTHNVNHEAGYNGGDFLGGIEFESSDSSAGGGVRTAIKTEAIDPYNTHSLKFYTADSNSTNMPERMSINHRGHVTTPYQPAFSFPSSTNFSVTTTGYRYMNSSNVFANVAAGTSLNVGNHFNTSNGRFTAPVNGVYEFNLTYGVILYSGYFLVYLEKNLSGSYYSIYNPTNQDGDWMFGTLNWKTFLYSGDFVTPMWNNNYSGGNLGHVKFSGHLIG